VLDNIRFDGTFRIAVDGVCFASFNKAHCEHCLRRTQNDKTTYFHYALVAMLVDSSGFVLPVDIEFIENTHEHGKPLSEADDEFKKQDCELKAFYRLTDKLKQHYPRLPICLLLDGLYANQKVFTICEQEQWDYFITLQDDSLPALQKKIRADYEQHTENRLEQQEEGKTLIYSWSGKAIQHAFGRGAQKGQKHYLFAISCTEIQKDKIVKFSYLCNSRPNRANIKELINQGGRQRWKIENQGFNTLKNHGMELEHGFGTTGNCLQNYFLLRLIALVIEQLMLHSNIFRKLQAASSESDLIHAATIKFFRSMRNLASQLLASLRLERISLPDISKWRVYFNSS
jgi:hypothetical protein